MNILWGMMGIIVILSIAFLFSSDKKNINIRTIFIGLTIQIIFAFLTLKSTFGRFILEELSFFVQSIINYTNEGISFLFAPLTDGDETIFALEVLTIIIFFSSLISILYYLKVMQFFINIIGGALAKLMKTTKIESLAASANIFVGHTEAPLVVKPFIKKISRSEIFAIMVGGMASVAGSVLVGYSLLGIPLEYLLAASFMAAPSGLVMAKIFLPHHKSLYENDDNQNVDIMAMMEEDGEKPANIIDAAATGASTGIKMIIEIAAMLLAFISLIALINGGVGVIGSIFGVESLTVQQILGIILSPIAFIIGVPWEEAKLAGEFIGEKIVINEFVAYASVGEMINSLSDKTVMVLSFALAGYANFGSIAIQIGALGALAPHRRDEVSKLGVRAMIAGSLASLLNAAIAGMFI